MKETLELLYKLQKLDDEIDELVKEEESIPGRKAQLEEDLKAEEEKLKNTKDEWVNIAKERKDKEIELDSIGDRIRKFQSQLLQVKSNKEYVALQEEINMLKEQSSKLEDEILELLDKGEEVNKAIAREEKNLEEARKVTAKEKAKLDDELQRVKNKIAIKRDERKRLVSGLDEMLLARYQRIRDNKGGLAVTPVKNGACGGCFRRIPPQEMQELKKMDRIITCEGCGRIIIWRGEDE